jgi:hypothetical protein
MAVERDNTGERLARIDAEQLVTVRAWPGWTPTMTQLLPNLATSEDEEQQHEIGLLSHADVYAGALVGGPLLNMLTAGEATEVRLMNAIDALSETQTPESEAVGDDVLELLNQRTLWAYRLGLMVGLRLTQPV